MGGRHSLTSKLPRVNPGNPVQGMAMGNAPSSVPEFILHHHVGMKTTGGEGQEAELNQLFQQKEG